MPNFEAFNIEKPPRQSDERTFFEVGFFLLILILSLVSGYTTFKGFSFNFPIQISLSLAVVVTLGLVLINIQIRSAVRNQLSLTGPFLVFSIIFSVSLISNTNAMYTFFVEDTIVKDTQERALESFSKGISKISAAVKNTEEASEFNELAERFENSRTNLKRQITDPANPGLGAKAQVHLRELETLLGTRITSLRAPSSSQPLDMHAGYAERLDDLLEEQFNTRTISYSSLVNLSSRMEEREQYFTELNGNAEFSRGHTDAMKRELDRFVASATPLVGTLEPIEPVDDKTDDVGSFQYTWRNFRHLINTPAILLAIILSILLDSLAPAFSIAFSGKKPSYV